MINIPGFPGLYSGLTRGAGSLTFNEEVEAEAGGEGRTTGSGHGACP